MNGRCTECGIEFAWVDVFHPERSEMRWYTEHAQNPWQMLIRTPGTLIRLLYPPIYWARIHVMMEVRIRRLMIWALMVAISMHFFASVFIAMGNWAENGVFRYTSFMSYLQTFGFLGVVRVVFNALFIQIAYMEFDPAGNPYFGWGVTHYTNLGGTLVVPLSFAGMLILWLIILLVIPTTRKRAMLRGAHVARASILSVLAIWIIFELARAITGWMMWSAGAPAWMIHVIPWFILASMIWMLVLWGSAVRTGWQIRPARLLLILGTIASVLGGMAFTLVPYSLMSN